MSEDVVTPQRSAWLRSAPPLCELPILERDLEADTVIIGGGYAGMNAAIRLTELGRDAIVLDMHEPGFGASGRNGGHVVPGLKYDPCQLIERFGEKRGRALATFAGNAAAQTFDLIERYELKCDIRRCGWLQPSVDARTTALVHRRAALWKEFAGVQTTVLDAAQTKAATGTSFYIGAWIDPRGGQLQPLAYARELARVAASRGVRIFRNSRANQLLRSHGRWHVSVNGATVRAHSILVCTNGYTTRLIPSLRRSYIAASSILCATEPLPLPMQKEIMPARIPISDARRLINYMQFDADGRFMIGARGSFGLHEPESYFDRLRSTAEHIFPALKGVEWKDAWGGNFALTKDHLPHVHNPAEGLFAVLGCNGRGVAMHSQLGRLVADLAMGEMSPDQCPLPISPITPIPIHACRRIAVEVTALCYRVLDRLGA
jgi:glycine/D-amino acid oxidase-like deaminating enzyme